MTPFPNPPPTQHEQSTETDAPGGTPHGSWRFWLLARAGPLTRTELGGSPTVDDRRLYDVRQFNPMVRTESVVYLGEYHDTEAVLRQWLNANRDVLSGTSSRSITYALDGEFEAAWQTIRTEDAFDTLTRASSESSSGGEQEQKTCRFCGESGIGNFPQHLRSCEEKPNG